MPCLQTENPVICVKNRLAVAGHLMLVADQRSPSRILVKSTTAKRDFLHRIGASLAGLVVNKRQPLPGNAGSICKNAPKRRIQGKIIHVALHSSDIEAVRH